MLFNSGQFLIFFPIVLLVYYIIPLKIRYIWLLLASYFFYMCWNVEYIFLLVTSTVITYISGIMLDKVTQSGSSLAKQTVLKKWIVFGSFVLNLSILFYFKYSNFVIITVNQICRVLQIDIYIPTFDILLPVGISFFTFQALSYTMDVYREEIYAERNFFKYALFVSFFPQLVAGPIERSKNLLKQLAEPRLLSFNSLREGILLMLWGYFLKLVMADRIAIFVDEVYGNYDVYSGVYLIVATLLFAIQIYCDFAGYSTIAMGTAKILGVELMENFNSPYMASTVSDFWRRWHISLSSWFKDYLYIPLGGGRNGIVKKNINKIIVFLISGLWHGAQWNFVVWGGLNGLYQVLGEILYPVRERFNKVFFLNKEAFSHKLLKVFTTFVLIDFSWIFFRANNVKDAFSIIKSMVTVYNPWILFDNSLYNCGLNQKNFAVMMFSILILLFADYEKYKGVCIRKIILEQEYWFRWLIFVISAILILIFGIWGNSYEASGFIYFQF